MTCPSCASRNISQTYQVKGAEYAQCSQCRTLYAIASIDHLVKTENDKPGTRNALSVNKERLKRLDDFFGKKVERVVDFGYGQGQLLKTCWDDKRAAVGLEITDLASSLRKGFFEGVFMVEVIEHLSNPGQVLKELYDVLVPGGVLYVETTFSDNVGDPGNHSYVDPEIGHRTILSHSGFDHLVKQAGFAKGKWINPHVAVAKK